MRLNDITAAAGSLWGGNGRNDAVEQPHAAGGTRRASLSRFSDAPLQPPAWSLRAELIYGIAAVDAVNGTHLMIQVAGFARDVCGRCCNDARVANRSFWKEQRAELWTSRGLCSSSGSGRRLNRSHRLRQLLYVSATN